MVRRLLVLISILLLFQLPASAQEGPLVKSIRVKGLKRVEESAVLRRLSQKVGEPLSRKRIEEDIKKIYRMGYFEDVRVETELFEGGLRLVYIVKEKPSIIRVEFQGNKEFDDEKLQEQITITPGAISDATLIRENVRKLRSFYEGEGYWLSRIVPVVKEISEDEVSLTFLIDEGEKVRIDEIRIEGNEALSDRQIKKAMETRTWWIFSFITSTGYYKKSVMEGDIERIKDLYYDHGFLNVVVSEPEVELTPDGRKMIITIRVSEGPQYRVSSIKFEGVKALDEETVRGLLPLGAGEVFSRGKLKEGIKRISEFYSERGYALVSIEPEVIPDEESLEVEIVMQVEEGEIFHIGRIEVSGNTRTRDKVIRREMRLDEGDTFNSKLLKRSYERIVNLNFFETVDIVPKPRVEERLIDIDVKVKEKATGFLSIGGGYSTVDKFMALIDLTQANLFGTGRYIKIKGEFGGVSTYYELAYRDPWFLDRPISFGLSAYRIQRDYIAYEREATGGSISFGKRFGEYWGGSLTYRFEEVTIRDVSESASNIIKEQVGTATTSSITPSVVRDTRDNFLDPTRGSRTSLTLTYAGIGGDNYFVKGVLDSGWFFPLGSNTIALRARAGYATGIFGRELPLYERFYLGGMYTIRGLGFGEGGPRDEKGDVIGGTTMFILNTEFIFPLSEELKLKGVVFLDAGRAYDEAEPIGSDLRYTAGAGVRWLSPLGPIRIEYGYNIDRRDGEDTGKIEFAFGTLF